jgi:hypothetical protein
MVGKNEAFLAGLFLAAVQELQVSAFPTEANKT